MTRPLVEVADILRAQGNDFIDRHRNRIRFQQLKVMHAIERCRTAALGGHIDTCTQCGGDQTISYNSCRNRHCPKCQTQARPQVVAAGFGASCRGIFTGTWSGTDLVLSRATLRPSAGPPLFMLPVTWQNMARISVQSCPSDRNIMYAVSGRSYFDFLGRLVEDLYCVLKSVDGGQSWRLTKADLDNRTAPIVDTLPLFGDRSRGIAGRQQDHNNCIGVSADPNIVAIGWQNGYFISTNGGGDINNGTLTWRMVHADSSPHLHPDVHAVVFDQFDRTNQTLYIASDGGIAITNDLGVSHSSRSNRQLPNLQLGEVAPSPRDSGVLAVSVWDNGTNATALYPVADPWTLVGARSDGINVCFLKEGQLVSKTSDEVSQRAGRWDLASRKIEHDTNVALPGDVIPIDGTETGVVGPIANIRNPLFINAKGERMLAVAGQFNQVYGLYWSSRGKGTSTGGLYWSLLATLPLTMDSQGQLLDGVSATGSFDGNQVFAGTATGRIFRLQSPGWTATDMTSQGTFSQLNGFAFHSPSLAFAIAADRKFLRMTAGVWNDVPGPTFSAADGAVNVEFEGIETDAGGKPPNVYVCSLQRVFASSDDGATWNDISAGLPVTPVCRDIRFVLDKSGARFLYLATYGRSVWQLLLDGQPGIRDRVYIEYLKIDFLGPIENRTREVVHEYIYSIDLSAERPREDIVISESVEEGRQIDLSLSFQWLVDRSIEVRYFAHLTPGKEDPAKHMVKIAPGAFHLLKAELEGLIRIECKIGIGE